MKINLSEIKAPHRKERDQEIEPLANSISDVGQITPIVLNKRNEIIAGKRIYWAAKKNKMAKVDVIYFEKSAIDEEIASLDSNLMVLPLGEVDHDLAIARRKKLYEQKYPETRQYATEPKGTEKAKPFSLDMSDTLGITRRTVERAVERATKSSPSVTNARREGKLSSSVVNELVRLPTSYQDTVLPAVRGKSVAEVKSIVNMALQKDADYAVSKASKPHKKATSILFVERNIDRLKESLENAFKYKVKCEPREAAGLIKKAEEAIELLDKFVDQNTIRHKPILRKHQDAIAS